LTSGTARLYEIHGYLVESEVVLHGREVDGAGDPAPDYRVLEGEPRDFPSSPPAGRVLAERRDDGFEHWTVESQEHPGRWTIRYAGICDVTLDRDLRTITVHRALDADPGLMPIFLEGNVLSHALAADGLLVLHASAVEIGGVALAIVGPSGSGKSTLAALLCAEGASLVADDALRIDVTETGAICFPGSRGLRLRPAAASMGSELDGAVVQDTADGRTKVLPSSLAAGPLKLEAALLPWASREATRLDVQRLGAMEGLQQLLGHPRLTWWRASEQIGQLFDLTAELAPILPVYTAIVPWGPPFPAGLGSELLAGVGLGGR
jgi:hypothetical protein